MHSPGVNCLLSLSIITLLLIAMPSKAADQVSSGAPPTPVYQPPMRGAPASRVGGASRGERNGALILRVLAPESIGLTRQAQPTLYWYSSTSLSMPLEFTLIDEQSIKPLVDRSVNAPQPGIHALPLHYTLKPEVEYQWSIAAVTDPGQRASDTIASGAIKYVQPPAPLAARLSNASVEELPFLYAQAGFWYDAIAVLSEQIAAQPMERRLREQRAALLEQVGLKAVAAYDREMKP
ncbi:MAG: DUF928 domain-containing protein [Gammaproteobacteria bacterium]|nr:DUF928 domain-containing protein [Gammaproteobacteria bacterium]MCP5196864.1 DUF928 domain-containing protein [Gammaproteobacteria bacterium]